MVLPRLGEEDQDLMWQAGYERMKRRSNMNEKSEAAREVVKEGFKSMREKSKLADEIIELDDSYDHLELMKHANYTVKDLKKLKKQLELEKVSNMKVYLVKQGTYDARRILKVFDKRELAENFINGCLSDLQRESADIEEWKVHDKIKDTWGEYYFVRLDFDGSFSDSGKTKFYEKPTPVIQYLTSNRLAYVIEYSKEGLTEAEEKARKVLNEVPEKATREERGEIYDRYSKVKA